MPHGRARASPLHERGAIKAEALGGQVAVCFIKEDFVGAFNTLPVHRSRHWLACVTWGAASRAGFALQCLACPFGAVGERTPRFATGLRERDVRQAAYMPGRGSAPRCRSFWRAYLAWQYHAMWMIYLRESSRGCGEIAQRAVPRGPSPSCSVMCWARCWAGAWMRGKVFRRGRLCWGLLVSDARPIPGD
jgi:hypothetical protein